MTIRATRVAALALCGTLAFAAYCAGAATASGRNWQVTPVDLRCEGNGAFLVADVRIRYAGAKGLVEAPLTLLTDGAGKRFSPQSLVYKSGRRDGVQWLISGGVSKLEPGDIGEFQFKFDVRGASGEVRLEFGDVGGLAITRKDASGSVCERLLAPGKLQVPARPGATRSKSARQARVYRAAYPCIAQDSLRTIEAKYPPYLPKQLLVFGRGYLPNTRRIDLPMGAAPAQAYAYKGLNDLDSVENAARRALGDFPEYAAQAVAGQGDARRKVFLFNWGSETVPSGELYSVGVYELRACPG